MAQHLGRINNCAWLCPARAGASSIHVCATLGDPHKLLPWPNLFLAFAFPTCLRHACLPDAWLAFVFLQTWQSPRANLQPAARVPIVSARRLVRLSLAFPASLCPLYPPNVLFVSPHFHTCFAFPTCGCHSCLWAACAVLCTLPLQSPQTCLAVYAEHECLVGVSLPLHLPIHYRFASCLWCSCLQTSALF